MAGVTSEELQVIKSDNYMQSDLLTEREKAAVLWAEHVTLNTAKYRDDVFQQVRSNFSEAEIVELTLLCAFRNMRNRLHDSLLLDLDDPVHAKMQKSDSKINPDRLRDYVNVVADNWPVSFPKAPHE